VPNTHIVLLVCSALLYKFSKLPDRTTYCPILESSGEGGGHLARDLEDSVHLEEENNVLILIYTNTGRGPVRFIVMSVRQKKRSGVYNKLPGPKSGFSQVLNGPCPFPVYLALHLRDNSFWNTLHTRMLDYLPL